MAEPETAQGIDNRAARWAIRVDAGTLDQGDRAELDAWLSGDPRRLGAFVRARAGLRLLEHAGAARQASATMAASAPMPPVSRASRMRRHAGVGAIALSLTLLAGIGVKTVLAARHDVDTRQGQRSAARSRRGRAVGRSVEPGGRIGSDGDAA